MTTLQQGSTGAEVQKLQRQLAEVGFSAGAIDGIFGPETDRAVRAFQASAGLAVDGIVGPLTTAALSLDIELDARLNEAPVTVNISSSVGLGGSNNPDDVSAVQAALKEAARLTMDPRLDPGPEDRKSGVGTAGAIERFQRRLGMHRPDARIDPGGYTLKRLNGLLAIDGVNLTFPFARSSKFPFFGEGAGMRAFGALRSKGKRAHAGVDIYFPDFTDVLALADGTVTSGPYDFYCRTCAIEIDHGPVVARYGEVAPESTPPVRKGDTVKQGQKIGRVGILTELNGQRYPVESMMLHLELYDKTETGALSQEEGTSARSENQVPFFRRRDLIDPSGFILRAPLP